MKDDVAGLARVQGPDSAASRSLATPATNSASKAAYRALTPRREF